MYLKNIIILYEDHDQHLQGKKKRVVDSLRPSDSLKLKKCHWLTTKVRYLGHTITLRKLSVTEAHTKKLKNMRHPRTFTEHRSFLGMCSVYCWFVGIYSRIAAPLSRLLKKDLSVTLPPLEKDQVIALKTSIEAIRSTPIFLLPRPKLLYSVDRDACDHQLGAALF